MQVFFGDQFIMNSYVRKKTATARKCGTGRVVSSSQGSPGRVASATNPATVEVISISELLLLFVVCFCYCYYFLFILLILSGDVELNPGPARAPRCRIMYHNIRGLYANLSELQIASRDYDIILCSETLVSSRRHVSELLLPDFNKPTLLLRDARPRVRGLAAYIRSGFLATVRKDFICNCHEVQLIKVCSKSNNFYIFSLYRNPDLDDRIYDCLLTSMSNIQECDRKSCFVFVGDLNAHHREWLSSNSTDRHGVAALDFANLSDCVQLIDVPTHTSDNCLDLLLTDVPGVVDAVVNPPLGSSDHSVVSFKLKLTFETPNIQFARTVFLKSRADWDGAVRDFGNIRWSGIFHDPNPMDKLNTELVGIVNRRVPTKIIRSRLRDKVWFNDDCRVAFQDKQTAYNLWSRNRSRLLWEDYVRVRDHAQSVNEAARRVYNDKIRDTLAEASHSNKWWSSLKNFLFGIDSALPPIRKENGAVSFDPSVKAEVFSSVFQQKQSAQVLQLPATCFPQPKLSYFAFKSSEVKFYLNDLDSSGGSDPNGLFPLFLKKIANQLAPKLARIFRLLLSSGSFPETWRQANVTPIPKGCTPTQFPSEYRPISITPILSKVYERLIARRLNKFVNLNGILPDSQFGFRKGLGTTDALLALTHDLQSSLDDRVESRVISLDFSSAFDLVNHKALLYKLQLMGLGGPVLNIFKEFLSNRKQRVSIDGKFSEFKAVVSGVPQGSVLGPLLFILFTADMGANLENKIVSYADDTTLYAKINSPSERTAVASSLTRDLNQIQSWCLCWGMKLNPSKTHSLIVSRSRTSHPPHPPLFLCGTALESSSSLKLLGVTIDEKLTFEKHLRSMAASIAQKTGLIRKCFRTLGNDTAVMRSFYAFILPCFEYCMPVWSSAADSHLKLLDRALNNIRFFLPDISIDLEKRRRVGCLSLLFKIIHNSSHPLHASLPDPYIQVRPTRYALALNDQAFSVLNTHTNQFARCFVPSVCRLWNDLPNDTIHSADVGRFKSSIKAIYYR